MRKRFVFSLSPNELRAILTEGRIIFNKEGHAFGVDKATTKGVYFNNDVHTWPLLYAYFQSGELLLYNPNPPAYAFTSPY